MNNNIIKLIGLNYCLTNVLLVCLFSWQRYLSVRYCRFLLNPWIFILWWRCRHRCLRVDHCGNCRRLRWCFWGGGLIGRGWGWVFPNRVICRFSIILDRLFMFLWVIFRIREVDDFCHNFRDSWCCFNGLFCRGRVGWFGCEECVGSRCWGVRGGSVDFWWVIGERLFIVRVFYGIWRWEVDFTYFFHDGWYLFRWVQVEEYLRGCDWCWCLDYFFYRTWRCMCFLILNFIFSSFFWF